MKGCLDNIALYTAKYKDLICKKRNFNDQEYDIKINEFSETLVNNIKLLEILSVAQDTSFKDTVQTLKSNCPEVLEPLFASILVQGYMLQGYVIADELLNSANPAKEAIALLSKLGSLYLNIDAMNSEEFMIQYFIYHIAFSFVIAFSELSKPQLKEFMRIYENMEDGEEVMPFFVGMNLTEKILDNAQIVLPDNIFKKYRSFKLHLSNLDINFSIGAFLDINIQDSIVYERFLEIADGIANILYFDNMQNVKTASKLLDSSKDVLFSYIKNKNIEFIPSDLQFEKYILYNTDSLQYLLQTGEDQDKDIIKDVIKYKTILNTKITENKSDTLLEKDLKNKSFISTKKIQNKENKKDFELKSVERNFQQNTKILIGMSNSCELIQKLYTQKVEVARSKFKAFEEYNIIPFGISFNDFKNCVDTRNLQENFTEEKSFLKTLNNIITKFNHRSYSETKHKLSFNARTFSVDTKNFQDFQKNKTKSITSYADLMPDFAYMSILIRQKYTEKIFINNEIIEKIIIFLLNTENDFKIQEKLKNLNWENLYSLIKKINIKNLHSNNLITEVVDGFLDMQIKNKTVNAVVSSFVFNFVFNSVFEQGHTLQNFKKVLNELFFNFEFVEVYKKLKANLDTFLHIKEFKVKSLENDILDISEIKLVNLQTQESIEWDGLFENDLTPLNPQKLRTIEEQKEEESPLLKKQIKKTEAILDETEYYDTNIQGLPTDNQLTTKDMEIQMLKEFCETLKETNPEKYAEYLQKENELKLKLSGQQYEDSDLDW